MDADTAHSDLPPLYAAWMTDALGGPLLAETEATCADCAMCTHGSPTARADDGAFDPTTKCCTYLPAIPNFLVGRILEDATPEAAAGRASVLARIEVGTAVTPLGLARTPLFDTLYRHGATRSFGRSRALRCPHYVVEGGLCGVWRNRESTCATWFCKHVRGAAAQSFWREALHPLLMAAEGGLARWCVLELDVDASVLSRFLSAPRASDGPGLTLGDRDLDRVADPATRDARWGRWAGREVEFYLACARLVAPLRWRDVVRLCGSEVQLFERAAQHAYRELYAAELPTRLRLGAFVIVDASPLHLRIRSYSDLDPMDLPRGVFDALRFFDGRATGDAVRAIKAEHGLEFDATLLRQLVDFGVLVDAVAKR